MTREERENAIRCLKLWIEREPQLQTYKTCLEALEQEPSGDAINRQAVLSYIYNDLGLGDEENGADIERQIELESSYRYVKSLPPIKPQEKTGYWIRWYEQKETEGYVDNIPHCKCSECGKEYDPHSSQFIKYCNECGAKMFEPQESEVNNG